MRQGSLNFEEVDRELDDVKAAECELLKRRNVLLAERSLEDVQNDTDLSDIEAQEDVSTYNSQLQRVTKLEIRRFYTRSGTFCENDLGTASLHKMLML